MHARQQRLGIRTCGSKHRRKQRWRQGNTGSLGFGQSGGQQQRIGVRSRGGEKQRNTSQEWAKHLGHEIHEARRRPPAISERIIEITHAGWENRSKTFWNTGDRMTTCTSALGMYHYTWRPRKVLDVVLVGYLKMMPGFVVYRYGPCVMQQPSTFKNSLTV